MLSINLKKYIITGIGLLIASLAYSQDSCGDLKNGYGPFDYRSEKSKLDIVEPVHFLPYIENLTRGNTSTTPGGDIDYTLRVSPNHHRALFAMMNLARKEKTEKPIGSTYSINCWLVRAERFRADDAMVKALYGIYLLRKGKSLEGAKKLSEAQQLSDDSDANIHYNLGLAYFDLKEYDKALASAHQAYRLGFQLPGLRNKLQKIGKWKVESVADTAALPNHDDGQVTDSSNRK